MNFTPAEETQSEDAGQMAGGFARVFDRVFTRHVMSLAVMIVVPLLFAATLNSNLGLMEDPDIWWHLANARILATTHQMIHTDPYSFTVAGHAWINWEWLSEQPFWFSYGHFGLQGIFFLTWLLLCGNVVFVYWRGYWRCRHAGAALAAAMIGFVLMTVNSGPRTIMFAYLAMSAELAILEAADRGRSRLLWLLPPLFCLWINLHGTWLIGILLLALYIACGLFSLRLGAFEQTAFSASQRNRLLAVLGASTLALLLNPYGLRLLWNPFDMMLNQKLSVETIAEWLPLNLAKFDGKAVFAAMALMVVANCIRGRKWKVFELAIVFLAWYATIAHIRFAFLAAVLTTPMLAMDIQRAFCTETDGKTIPAMNAAMMAAALCFFVITFPSEAKLRSKLALRFPIQTIETIQRGWRTFDWDYVGGMMAWEEKPSFIDSRFDSFDQVGVMAEYGSIMAGHNAFALMDKYRVDHALVKDGLPITSLLKQSPAWCEMRRERSYEGDYILFAKAPRSPGAAASPACLTPDASKQ